MNDERILLSVRARRLLALAPRLNIKNKKSQHTQTNSEQQEPGPQEPQEPQEPRSSGKKQASETYLCYLTKCNHFYGFADPAHLISFYPLTAK